MRYFTSDWHIGHRNILSLGDGRPFSSLEEMHSTLLKKAREVVGPEDEFYVLGDIALGNFEESLKVLEQFPGRKFLVPGNHDKIFPKLNSQSRIERFRPMYESAGFEVLGLSEVLDFEVDGETVKVRLAHMPYSSERYSAREDRLAFARPFDDGLWLIHGHTHSSSKESENSREIHVGVDANDWAPVSEETIIDRLRKRVS